MNQIMNVIKNAQEEFKNELSLIDSEKGIPRELYIRYLSMQYHLTKGVIKHFYLCASHESMTDKSRLRDFILGFGREEELHYKIAQQDLKALDREPLPIPLSVELWWAYFDLKVSQKPFIRLGATCVLENISNTSDEIIEKLMKNASYLDNGNTRFIAIHRHGPMSPHGDQILKELSSAKLSEAHLEDLLQGAKVGRHLYLEMARWALHPERDGVEDVSKKRLKSA